MSVTTADGVTASESGRDDPTRWLPWTYRRILALPGHPLALGAGATLLFLAVATVWLNAAGVWDGFDYQGRPFWTQANERNNLLYALTLGWVPVAVVYLARGTERDLRAISARLREPAALDDLRREVLGVSRGALAIATLIAAVLVGLDLWVLVDVAEYRPAGALHWCWIVGREVLGTVLFLRVVGWGFAAAINLSKLARERVAVRLLEPGDFKPLMQNGSRLAFFWMLMWAIWVPGLFSQPGGPDVFATLAPMFGVSALVGLIALAPAVLGAHRGLRDAKAAELTSTRSAIEAARVSALAAGGDSAESAARLPGLIAYERRISEVSEWPFDARSLGRVGLYLLIPLASWVGGALVERAVDALLG